MLLLDAVERVEDQEREAGVGDRHRRVRRDRPAVRDRLRGVEAAAACQSARHWRAYAARWLCTAHHEERLTIDNLGHACDEAGLPNQRPHYAALNRRLLSLGPDEFRRRKAMTDLSMQQDGVGFTVYRSE